MREPPLLKYRALLTGTPPPLVQVYLRLEPFEPKLRERANRVDEKRPFIVQNQKPLKVRRIQPVRHLRQKSDGLPSEPSARRQPDDAPQPLPMAVKERQRPRRLKNAVSEPLLQKVKAVVRANVKPKPLLKSDAVRQKN